ncbi:MAG: hypothetical protein ACLQO1_08995 [Steroidobacteraceae bacterium]
MFEEFAGRYADPKFNALELAATEWLDGFYLLEHLLCTRAWALRLWPDVSPELRFAALTHDAERFFPGGPTSTPTNGFDNPDYLFAHSIRSADIVEAWLRKQQPMPEQKFIARVRTLILRHEVGGNEEEDFLQAVDSLSFLESLDWLTVDWVHTSRYSIEKAREKLNWSVERIRPSAAVKVALPLYVAAVCRLEAAHSNAMDLEQRRVVAGDRRLLLGI